MTTAAHAAAGALVGALVPHPLGALVGGLVSHAVMDVVPHYDLPDWRVDAALTVGLGVGLIVVGADAAVTWGVIGGVVPDLENLVMKLGWIRPERRVFPTHDGWLPHGRALGPGQAWVQVAIAAAAVWSVSR